MVTTECLQCDAFQTVRLLRPEPLERAAGCEVTHALLVSSRGRGPRVERRGMWSGSTAPGPTRMRSRGEGAMELSCLFSVSPEPGVSAPPPQLSLHSDGGTSLLEV